MLVPLTQQSMVTAAGETWDTSTGGQPQHTLVNMRVTTLAPFPVAVCFYGAQGELDAASSSFAAAKGALEAGSGSGKNSSNSNSSSAANFVSDSSSCLSSRFQQEMAADVALGAAQVGGGSPQQPASLRCC